MRRTPEQTIAPLHWLAAAGLATIAHVGVIAPGIGSIELPYSEEAGVTLDLRIQTSPQPAASEPDDRSAAANAAPAVAHSSAPSDSTSRRTASRATQSVAPPSTVRLDRKAASAGASDYFTELQQWLAQFRDYPDSARRRGWEGVVELAFVIEPNGRVRGAYVARSSGFAILDNAAVEMLDRASPLPPVPAGLSDQALAITVPVGYHLNAVAGSGQ
ncbi:energy transducer TonB [Abyssibacter sp.]|uniref:energy transducer TonB n=1 Tax=Abyssibacter sp. TaxID=2320200 RepID=UPI0025B84806|nr:energy transducer TonB [Abyssibacter sp.]MCK5860043.1 energy transducer TonB [Abyssibacter sp.]